MAEHHVDISPRILFREIEGEAVLLDLDHQSYFGLDEIGTRIWQLLTAEGARGDVDRALVQLGQEYDAPPERLARDMDSFLKELAEAGLLRLVPASSAEE